jgi:hypothetical protein
MEKLKLQILKHIADGFYFGENPTYEQLLEAAYDNYYRCIAKVPTDVFILGTVHRYVLRDLEHANRILDVVKEVVTEILECNGIELTFTDEDWFNLKIVEEEKTSFLRPHKYILSSVNKRYMSEFFEI